jgi:O-antigen/teichoic acid export membrane protein
LTATATVRDTAALFLGNVTARLCALVAVVLVARILSPSDVAVVLVGQAIVAYLIVAMDFGLTPTAISLTAGHAAASGPMLGAVLVVRAGIALLGVAAITAAALVLPMPPQLGIVLVLYAAAASMSAFDVTWLPQALRSTVPRAALTAAIGLLSLALLVVLLTTFRRPEAPATAMLLAAAILTPLSLVRVLREYGAPSRPPKILLGELVRFALPLGLSSLLAQVYYNFDLLYLAAVRTPEEVAAYGSVYRIVLGLQMVAISYASVSLSRYVRAHAAGGVAYGRLIEQNLRVLGAIALPIAAGGTLLATQIVEGLFGSFYVAGAVPLAILLWAVAVAYLHSTLIAALSAVGRGWAVTRAIAVATIVNVGLNVILIPTAGMIGAAAATLAAESVVLALILVQRRNLPPLRRLAGAALAPVPPTAVMSIAVVALLAIVPTVATPLAIAVGAIVYGVASLAIGGWTEDERGLARGLGRRVVDRLLRRREPPTDVTPR